MTDRERIEALEKQIKEMQAWLQSLQSDVVQANHMIAQLEAGQRGG